MSISVDISPQEIADLKQLTRQESDAEAITQAAREFLRLGRLRELKAASGKVEFDSDWQDLEHLEFSEPSLPE